MTIYLCVTILLHFQETYNIHIWQYVPLPRNIQHPYMAICSTSKKHTTSIYGNLFHFQETYNIHIWQFVPLPRNIQHPYMAICSTSKKHTTSIYGNMFH